MTVHDESQTVTDQIIQNIDMFCIDNSISCVVKKTTLGTYDQTSYFHFNICPKKTVYLSPLQCLADPVLSERAEVQRNDTKGNINFFRVPSSQGLMEGIVASNKELVDLSVPSNKELLEGTVPSNSFILFSCQYFSFFKSVSSCRQMHIAK